MSQREANMPPSHRIYSNLHKTYAKDSSLRILLEYKIHIALYYIYKTHLPVVYNAYAPCICKATHFGCILVHI